MQRILLWLMAMVLAGCGCNTEGCGNDLRLGSAALAQWADSEAYQVEVCVNGECQSLSVPATSTSPWFGFPVREGLSGEVEVAVTVTVGSDVKRASGLIELESYHPNGAFCSPVCSGADLMVDGNSVRNAQPGLIQPRD